MLDLDNEVIGYADSTERGTLQPRNLLRNGLLVHDEIGAPDHNQCSSITSPSRFMPTEWELVSGYLRIEDRDYALMTQYQSQLPAAITGQTYGMVVLAGTQPGMANTAANTALGSMMQRDIVVQRGGQMVLSFYSIRNPFNSGYNCLSSPGANNTHQYRVTFGNGSNTYSQDFLDVTSSSAPNVQWIQHPFAIGQDGAQQGHVNPGTYNLTFGPSAAWPNGGADKICNGCACVVTGISLQYRYGFTATLMDGPVADVATNRPFPALRFQLREDGPGTPVLPNALAVFTLDPADTTGTHFNTGEPSFSAQCDRDGIVTLPAGTIIAGPRVGNIAIGLTCDGDEGLSQPLSVHIKEGRPPQGSTLDPETDPITATVDDACGPVEFLLYTGIGDPVIGATVTVAIKNRDGSDVDPEDSEAPVPYFSGSLQIVQCPPTDRDGMTSTPELYAGQTGGEYQLVATWDDFPTVRATLDLTVKVINSFEPINEQVSASRAETVRNRWWVVAKDERGALMPNAHVQFHIITSNGAGGRFVQNMGPSILISTDDEGKAVVPDMNINDVPGLFRLNISNTGLPSCSTRKNISVHEASQPAHVEFRRPFPNLEGVLGETFDDGWTRVRVTDISGNPVEHGTVNFRINDKVDADGDIDSNATATGTRFLHGIAGTSDMEAEANVGADGLAPCPGIFVGANVGNFRVTATVRGSQLSDAHVFQLVSKKK
ncbi:hypothetical protein [Paludibacterium purpuratum]|uniref:Uncharacterized protein n=1 Tax=Paludibacterium purpuratum TaxID=1144873 RepID=A0A4R7B1T6_9NEIS|nr:hypothetical protein [Paludibacterium purpuratum]TDR73907.1 hypothetical protein DFP86_112111 [Paludibacterium purpuratum]